MYSMPLKSSLCYSVALATVATATLAPVASAATFNFSYTSSAGTITATVDGTLQPDNNRVFVSSISNTTFNGSPAPALPLIGSYLNGFLPPNAIVGNTTDLFASGSAYGSTLPELFVLANYSLTTVPEPATVLGLLSVAGVGLLCKGRKLEK